MATAFKKLIELLFYPPNRWESSKKQLPLLQGFASVLSGPQTNKTKVNLHSKLGTWKILLFQYLDAAVHWLQYSKRNHENFLMKLLCAVHRKSGMIFPHLSLLLLL